MSRGSAIMGPAAVVAFVCFFLPWVTSSCQGQPVATLSGRELAAGTIVELRPAPGAPAVQTQRVEPQRSLYAIPLVALVCLLLVALALMRVIRPPLAGLIAGVLAILCLLILLNRTIEIRRQADDNGFEVEARYGVFGVTLAYLAMLLGGIVDVFTGWTPRAAGRAGPAPPP
jgi:hypothetical protein